MTDTTIIYYTDNYLGDPYKTACQNALMDAADGKRIVSVSQHPIKFGDNVCVGDIGRSHISLYSQMLLGGQNAKTRYVALAEHDCMYTDEHFNWKPPRDDVFYYNINHYIVQGYGEKYGEYTYVRYRPLSQLVCNRDLFLRAITEKVWLLENGWMLRKGATSTSDLIQIPRDHIMKPDPPADDDIIASLAVEPGVLDHRKLYLEALKEFKDLGKELGRWKAKGFSTVNPNLDIITGQNFSSERRGRKSTYSIEPWGKFEDVMKRYYG